MKRFIAIGLVLFSLLTVLAACGIRDQASTPTGPTAKMGGAAFLEEKVTVKKGETLTIIDTVAVPHVIANGTWINGQAKPAVEQGAPTVNLNYTGNDTVATPPFNTAGTFKLYCTIHGNMNLTVVVQ